MMRSFFKSIIIQLGTFFLLAYVVSYISFWGLKKSSFYKPSFLVNSVSESNFDYIVLGASTGLTTLNTKIVDSLSGLNGINLSMDDSNISSQYLMLKHFLAEGKKTKYCVISPALSWFDSDECFQGTNDYRFLMYYDRLYISEYYREVPSRDKTNTLSFSEWLPSLGLFYYNTELFFPSIVSLVKPKKKNRFDNKGNYSYPSNGLNLVAKDKIDKKLIFDNSCLKKLEDLCVANEITVVYYFSPNRMNNVIVSEFKRKIINHSGFIDEDEYFYDDIHVNLKGNMICSIEMAKEFELVINSDNTAR